MKKALPLLFLIPNLAHAESYLCIAEASGGVKYNSVTKKYSGTGFLTDSKYIVKKEKDKWTFSTFGGKKMKPLQRVRRVFMKIKLML